MANRQDSETQLSGIVRVRNLGPFNLIRSANIQPVFPISKPILSE